MLMRKISQADVMLADLEFEHDSKSDMNNKLS